jgi:hypothetical protein
MHPLIAQALIADHLRELHANAAASGQARLLRRARRTGFAVPRPRLLADTRARRMPRAA